MITNLTGFGLGVITQWGSHIKMLMKLQERRAEISAVVNDVAAANCVGDIDMLITTQFWKGRYIFYQNTDFSFDLADFID